MIKSSKSSIKKSAPPRVEEVEEAEELEEEPSNPFEYLSQINKEMGNLENRGIINISSEISKESLARATRTLLRLHFSDFNDPVQIIINSPGGFTDAGWAFIDMMDFVNLEIRTIAMGEVCSMGCSIFIAGDHRIMSPNSCAMIHQFTWSTAGNYGELVAQRKAEDMEHEREVRHFINHSKYKTETEIRKHVLLECDHWLTPKDMLSHGLCDEIYVPRKDRKKKKDKK